MQRFDAFLDSPIAAAADCFVQLCHDMLVVSVRYESKEVYDKKKVVWMLPRQLEGCTSFVSWMNGDLDYLPGR